MSYLVARAGQCYVKTSPQKTDFVTQSRGILSKEVFFLA